MRRVVILHGVADRDPMELVCQMFPGTRKGLAQLGEFIEALPGKYQILVWKGISHRRAKVVSAFVQHTSD